MSWWRRQGEDEVEQSVIVELQVAPNGKAAIKAVEVLKE
jgi:hypothetical protein